MNTEKVLIITTFKVLYENEYNFLFFEEKDEFKYSCEHVKEFSDDITPLKYCPACGKKYLKEHVKNKIPKKGVKLNWRCPTPDNAVVFINEDDDMPHGKIMLVCKMGHYYVCFVVEGENMSYGYRLTINGIPLKDGNSGIYNFPCPFNLKHDEKDREFLLENLKKYDTENILGNDLNFGILTFDNDEYIRYYYC